MAKFSGKNLEFLDYQKAIFGDEDNSAIYWDGTQLVVTTTASGVSPVDPWHLTTKGFVEDYVGSALSGINDHGNLSGLLDDDHMQYVPVDGSRGFTGTVSGIAPTESYHLTTKQFLQEEILNNNSDIDGGSAVTVFDENETIDGGEAVTF